jgi:hypothetical protein
MSLTSSSSFQASVGARDGLSSMVSEPLLPEHLASQEYFDPVVEPSPKTGKRLTVYLALLGTLIVVIVLAVVLPIYFVVIKPKSHVDATSADASSSSGTSSGGGNSGGSGGVIVSITVSSRFYVSKESIVSSMATMELWLSRIMAHNSPIIIRLKDIV